jgi:hypothetical protein
VLHWFTRERTASPNHEDDTGAGAGALGQPHVLRLANRVESYVDIENKVMRLPNAGRSINMSSQVDANANANASTSVSADESGSESNTASESNNVVRGTMV